MVHRELLKFRRGQFGQPWHFVDFSRGRGVAITNEAAYGQEGVEAERKEHVLDDPSVLAIKGLGQFKEFRVVASAAVVEMLLDEESVHLAGLSDFIGRPISLSAEPSMNAEQYDIVLM